MVTDAYSRKIVGFAVDDNMEAGNMIKALEMANAKRLNPTGKPSIIQTADYNIVAKNIFKCLIKVILN